MSFQEAKETLKQASKKLDDIWAEAYHCASELVHGNWQDPDVMKRRKELAVKIADKLIQGKELTITWEIIGK